MRTFLFLLLIAPISVAQFPTVEQGDYVSNDKRFAKKVPRSKEGELTIVSFNIRNLGARQRGLANYIDLLKNIDNADVIVIQEYGLGIFDKDSAQSVKEEKKTRAVQAWFQILLGEEWVVVSPRIPSGSGNSAESAILAYRKEGQGFDISVEWAGFVDLGNPLRDMATFTLTTMKGTEKKVITLGSCHLKPDDPTRGQEMIAVAHWMVERGAAGEHALVMGDFNWGYNRKSGVENYLGEDEFERLHQEGMVYQLFRELSYRGNGKPGTLRTTTFWRSGGHFYDQFFLTPVLAGDLADGGKLQEDCGIVMIGKMQPMKSAAEKLEKANNYGLDQMIKQAEKEGVDLAPLQGLIDHARKKAASKGLDDATWIGSDHRPIWVQIKI